MANENHVCNTFWWYHPVQIQFYHRSFWGIEIHRSVDWVAVVAVRPNLFLHRWYNLENYQQGEPNKFMIKIKWIHDFYLIEWSCCCCCCICESWIELKVCLPESDESGCASVKSGIADETANQVSQHLKSELNDIFPKVVFPPFRFFFLLHLRSFYINVELLLFNTLIKCKRWITLNCFFSKFALFSTYFFLFASYGKMRFHTTDINCVILLAIYTGFIFLFLFFSTFRQTSSAKRPILCYLGE